MVAPMTSVPERFLRSLRAAGVRRVPRGRAPARDLAAAERGAAPSSPAGPTAPADPAEALAAVAAEVAGCRACPLCEKRDRTVPGEGAPTADIVFVGEGPGADEDRSGRPFVGAAGQLLDKIITNGMKLRREDVFICNVVKCRPPGNRNPTPDEAAACTGYLERQLDALAPKVVCALGKVAAQHLTGSRDSLRGLRGRVYEYRGIPVIATYHPAYLLRDPSAKVETWRDIQRVMEIAATR